MVKLEIRLISHATGERVCLLFTQNPYQPLLLPLLWATLARRSKARTTVDIDMRAIKEFYDHCAKIGLDLEQAILDRNFEPIIASYRSFASWIKNKQKTPRAIVSKNFVHNGSRDTFLSAGRINASLGSLKLFLTWCGNRYASNSDRNGMRPDQLENKLKQLFDANRQQVLLKNNLDGLEPDQVLSIRAHIDPQNPANPYPTSVRARNCLIFEFFVETGMRLSELLKVQTVDIREVNGRYFVALVDRENDPNDPRRYEPGFKTLERTIEITQHLYDAVDVYVDHFRRPTGKNGKPIKLTHQYLFTNYMGDPLGATSVHDLFRPLKKLLNLSELSPHKLRHTFANEFLEFLVDRTGMSLESAQDKLRYLGGWSLTSKMPQRYGRKYIAKLANRMNRDRIESAWERVRKS